MNKQQAYLLKSKGTNLYVHYDDRKGEYYMLYNKIGACVWKGLGAAQAFCKSITNGQSLEPVLLKNKK